MNIVIAIGIYLASGIIALGLLDLATKRIRNRAIPASQETRTKLGAVGHIVGSKESVLLTAGALWLFWPLVIYAAVSSRRDAAKKEGSNG